MFSASQINLIEKIRRFAQNHQTEVYLVGGFVRDALRGVNCADQDMDFVVAGDAIQFAIGINSELGGELKQFKDFFTAKIINPKSIPDLPEVDFASTRTEVYPKPGALPVVSISTIENDLRRRDFSINAMAISLERLCTWLAKGASPSDLPNYVIDQFKGLSDLKEKAIRVLHNNSFIDDPTRLFRAVRYAQRLGGHINSQTLELASFALKCGVLSTISEHRKLNELRKITYESASISMLKYLDELGVLKEVSFVPTTSPNFWHYIDELDKLNLKREGDLIYQSLLRLFYYLSSHAHRDEIFRGVGFGKHAFKTWSKDYDLIEPIDPVKLSDSALVLGTILGTGHIKLFSAELKHRNLIIADAISFVAKRPTV